MASHAIEFELTCPYCDEDTHKVYLSKTIKLPYRNYALLECIMGHRFYATLEIPEMQSEIVKELDEMGIRHADI